jgi:hypothetical protein
LPAPVGTNVAGMGPTANAACQFGRRKHAPSRWGYQPDHGPHGRSTKKDLLSAGQVVGAACFEQPAILKKLARQPRNGAQLQMGAKARRSAAPRPRSPACLAHAWFSRAAWVAWDLAGKHYKANQVTSCPESTAGCAKVVKCVPDQCVRPVVATSARGHFPHEISPNRCSVDRFGVGTGAGCRIT